MPRFEIAAPGQSLIEQGQQAGAHWAGDQQCLHVDARGELGVVGQVARGDAAVGDELEENQHAAHERHSKRQAEPREHGAMP